MAVRGDIEVDFELSPRIATVGAGSVEVSVQDSHDTLSSIEDSQEGHEYLKLMNTAGGEALGGGTTVGLTTTLENLQYAFEATSPRSSGTATTTDALGVTLTDSGATFISDGVVRGDWIINFSDQSVTEIIVVVSETELTTRGLRNGTANTFTNLDVYKVWEVSEAVLSGGNFVAVDDSNLDINPLFPSFGRFISKSSASSATSQSQGDIEYSSFEGGVWYDENSLLSVAEGKNGNAQLPLNNIPACVQVQANRGLPKIIHVLGDITLGTGDNVEDFKLIGVSHINSVLTVLAGADCLRTSFESFDMTGLLDGDSEITNCIVRNLEYFNGHIHRSYLAGTIKLRGSLQANISNCAILDVLDPPIIDAGGSGQNLMMPNFSGNVVIDNLTGASQLGIGIDAGRVTVNNTCTSGVITIGGSGEVVDNSGSDCYVVDTAIDGTDVNNIQYLIESMNDHHTGYGKVIFWDSYGGDDTFDGAHPKRATKTFAQAHTLADDNGHDIILALAGNPDGVTTVTEQIVISKNYTFLRGPGRDFIINGTNDLLAAIDITGIGVEVSGLRVSTSVTNTVAAIKSTGGFPLLKDLYVENSANGILVDDGEHGFIDNVRIGHNSGYAITVSGGSDHFVIKNSHLGSNAGGGIIVGLTSGHEVTIKDTVIHGNTGYGIDILSGSSHTQILGDVSLFGNSLGNVRDLGTSTTDNSNSDAKIVSIDERVRLIDKSVHVDTEQVINGDGSQENPFNNLNDTLTYAELLGLKIIHVLSDITIDRNLKNFIVVGIGTPAIDCNGQDLDKSEFTHCMMKGEYTGSIIVQDSVLFNGFRLNGFFENSVLAGDLVCINGAIILLKNCASYIQGNLQPSVSMVASGTCELGVRNYSGGFELRDMNNANDKCSIEPTAGAITLASSCAGTGSLSLKGIADLVNNSTLTNISDKLIKSEDIGFIKDMDSGKWHIVGDQMIFYASDNVTEISRFNLFDSSGNPTTTGEVFKRERV